MMAHLWTKQAQPLTYLQLLLCRDVYHCTPVELAKIPLDTVLQHLTCLQIEHQVAELNRKLNGRKPTRKRTR